MIFKDHMLKRAFILKDKQNAQKQAIYQIKEEIRQDLMRCVNQIVRKRSARLEHSAAQAIDR